MRPPKLRIALLLFDLLAVIAVMLLAFGIRFALESGPIPVAYLMTELTALPVLLPARAYIYYAFGLYRQMWTHASVPELLQVVYAVTVETLVSALVLRFLAHGFPRSLFIIGWLLRIAALCAIRLSLRLRHDWLRAGKSESSGAQRVLIYGAGDAGTMLAREYAKHPELGCTIVGFLDDDPHKRGFLAAGKPVLGGRDRFRTLVAEHRVTELVIAMPGAAGQVTQMIMEAARGLGLRIKTVPGLFELVDGTASVAQVRDVQIEDVLGREEVKVELDTIAAYLTGEVVLVTGAGGSIGSELCRQAARFAPSQLLLLGHGENSIYQIHLELTRKYPNLDIRPIIADVQDEARLGRVFEAYRPGVVFHAAAHKHVPLMELNPEEAIKNNLFGTRNVARAADQYRAKRFVLISSDKAVNPTSVMGATKRAAEYVIQSLARRSHTIFVAVRFGNVLGSRGSVVPLFKQQIAAGGPVTVTDARMVRYFMTIPEAARLVVQAAAMGKGGEVFLLDMGKPVRIIDLARDLIRLSGFEPDVDIPIRFTGMRDGEKLYEELLTAEEGTVATRHERIFMAQGDAVEPQIITQFMDSMWESAKTGQVTNQSIRATVADAVRKVTFRGAVEHGD